MVATGLLEHSFQLIKGVGPWREKDLWARGVPDWSAFEAAASREVVMSKRLDAQLLEAIAQARAGLKDGALEVLARLLPAREHWRLYPCFVDRAAFFDLEADDDLDITVGGVFDRDGPATFVKNRALAQLPARLARSDIWVSFNGGAFDVPVLQRHFAPLALPVAHIDLRFVVRRVGLKGGLKHVEEQLGLARPPHLKGVKGFDAIRLWREFAINKDLKGLRLLVEYNLYDCINLKSVLEQCCNRAADEFGCARPFERPFERGEVLYDLSRLVLAQQ